MRRAILAAGLVLLALVPSATAISGGAVDGTTHPNVGALVMRDASGETVRLCSGALISPSAFLTMAFCIGDMAGVIADGGRVDVTFDPALDVATSTFHPVSHAAVHPEVHWSSFKHMYGVAVLAQAVQGITPATLPASGLVDSIDPSALTVVGYGGSADCSEPGRCVTSGDGQRRRASAQVAALNPSVLELKVNAAATDGGGVCFGDLGAPYFLGTSNVLVAVGGGWSGHFCSAIAWAYRTDVEVARTFLDDFAPVP